MLIFLGIVFLAVITWFVYQWILFCDFKSRLMRAFAEIGIGYEDANEIYTLHRDKISLMHTEGRTPKHIAVFIVSLLKESVKRDKIIQSLFISDALNSLEIKLTENPFSDGDKFCVEATISIVQKILKKNNIQVNNLKIADNDFLTIGIFTFSIASYISDVMGCGFETVSSLALFRILWESDNQEFAEAATIGSCINIIGEQYNGVLKNQRLIEAICNTLITWIYNPKKENFDKLCSLYSLCQKSWK